MLSDIYYYLGQVKLSQKKSDEALVLFVHATEIDPMYLKAQLALGDIVRGRHVFVQSLPSGQRWPARTRRRPADQKHNKCRAEDEQAPSS